MTAADCRAILDMLLQIRATGLRSSVRAEDDRETRRILTRKFDFVLFCLSVAPRFVDSELSEFGGDVDPLVEWGVAETEATLYFGHCCCRFLTGCRGGIVHLLGESEGSRQARLKIDIVVWRSGRHWALVRAAFPSSSPPLT